MMKADNDNQPRLMAMAEVCQLTSLSRAMINKLRASGRFPAAVELCERRVAFVRAEVHDWVENKIAARAAA
jgi:prophage regulatory protein